MDSDLCEAGTNLCIYNSDVRQSSQMIKLVTNVLTEKNLLLHS
jgi:hypothetical protein